MSTLLKYQNPTANEEPIFGQTFGNYVRSNYPKLPIGYTKCDAVRIPQTVSIPLGTSPDFNDSDIYIYIGFKPVTISQTYCTIIGNSYVNEDSIMVRLLTNGTSGDSYYTNMFSIARTPSALLSDAVVKHMLMTKVNTSGFYFSDIVSSQKEYPSFTSTTPSQLILNQGNRIAMDLYGLYIRRNNVVEHNWVPCTRRSDSKQGFYNAVTSQFIIPE